MKSLVQNKTTALTLGLLALIWLVLFNLEWKYWRETAVLFSAIVLWCSEIIPLVVTALLVPVAISLLGILSPHQAFSAYGNEVVLLFIGLFSLALAAEKHGLSRRIAYRMLTSRLSRYGASGVTLAMAYSCWLIAMWISHTATTAMFVPICAGVLATLKDQFVSEVDFRHFSKRLLLICAFAPTASGLATPIGTPPNVMAFDLMQQNQIEFFFIDWLSIGLPLSFVALHLMLLMMFIVMPVKAKLSPSAINVFREKLLALGPMRTAEKQVVFVFLSMIVLWIMPDILLGLFPEANFLLESEKRLTLGVVGLGLPLLLYILPVSQHGKRESNLAWSDSKELDWGTLFLFGGGLCLGKMLSESGLAHELATLILQPQHWGLKGAGFLAVLMTICLSEFASNTASAAVILPLIFGGLAGNYADPEIVKIVLAVTFAAGFGSMFPVSTPPNALVYATGRLTQKDLLRVGFYFDLIGAGLIAIWLMA